MAGEEEEKEEVASEGADTPKGADNAGEENEGTAEDGSGATEEENANKEVENAVDDVKQHVLKTGSSVIKKGAKVTTKLIKAGPHGWIVLLIIVVIIILIGLIKTFFLQDYEFGGSIDSTSTIRYDTLMVTNKSKTRDMTEKASKYQEEVEKELKKYFDDEDIDKWKEAIEGIEADLRELQDSISDIDSMSNSVSGYQVLEYEMPILIYLERLSYPFTFLEWSPRANMPNMIWDEYKTISKKIYDLKREGYKSTFGEKAGDRAYRDKKCLNEDIEFFSEDSNMPEEYTLFYNKNNEEDEDLKREETYFHNKITRIRNYNSTIADSDLTLPNLNSWCTNKIVGSEEEKKDPSSIVVSRNQEDGQRYVYIPLQNLESRFRYRAEQMHNDIIIRNMVEATDEEKKKSFNSVLDNSEKVEQLYELTKAILPMYTYASYNEEIAEKTFFDYEMSEPDSTRFDENVNDSENFEEVVNDLYTGGKKTEDDKDNNKFLSYEFVNKAFEYEIARAQDELSVRSIEGANGDRNSIKYQNLVANISKYNVLLKEIYKEVSKLQGVIVEDDDAISAKISKKDADGHYENEHFVSDKLSTYYQNNFESTRDKILNRDEKPYEPKNHKVIELKDLYFDRYKNARTDKPEYITNYEETISVNAFGSHWEFEDVTIPDDAKNLNIYVKNVYEGVAKPSNDITYEVTSTVDIRTEQESLIQLSYEAVEEQEKYDYRKITTAYAEENKEAQALSKQLEESFNSKIWTKITINYSYEIEANGTKEKKEGTLGYKYIASVEATGTCKGNLQGSFLDELNDGSVRITSDIYADNNILTTADTSSIVTTNNMKSEIVKKGKGRELIEYE